MRPALPALLVLVAATHATAAPPVRPICPTAEARAAYLEGRRLLDGGDALGALDRLGAARAECPAPALDYWLAVALEKLGRLALSLDSLEKYLAAPDPLANRAAVEAWASELRTRVGAERQEVPPPSLPPRTPPGPPPPYFPDETAPPRPAPRTPSGASDDRWQLFIGGGLAVNGALQPGQLGKREGLTAGFGASYQLGAAYRVSVAARIDLAVLLAGQAFPWRRTDVADQTNVLFATLIAAGVRVDLPLWRGKGFALWMTPSLAAGLGSLSLDIEPVYTNALALRAGLSFCLERGTLGGFVEPEGLVLLTDGLERARWTAGVTAGARVRF